MARLVGVDLPREKRIEIALTYVFGIGRTRATETLAATGISPDKRVHELDDNDLVALRDHIEANYQTEGDLRRTVTGDIQDGDRQLPGPSPPCAPARSWPAHQDQRAYPQGPQAHRRRKEEVIAHAS